MSRANVEVVRRGLEAWQRDDLDGWLSACDTAVEWHAVLERLVGGIENSYRGMAGLRQLWSAYRTELESFELEAQELRDVDEDHVLVLGHMRSRGPASGIESQWPLGMVLTLRNGKVVRWDYVTHQEALEAVGLRE